MNIYIIALAEAEDINRYLFPLRSAVEELSSATEMADIFKTFRRMMHTLVLIWTNSKHYNTPNKITVIFQEICNDVIEQVNINYYFF